LTVVDAFGVWLLEQLANAARKRLGERLLGTEHERALSAAGQAAIAQAARKLWPNGSDEDVAYLAAVVDQVFEAHMPDTPLAEQPTILQALQACVPRGLLCWGMQR
jgi:hypothetical protein